MRENLRHSRLAFAAAMAAGLLLAALPAQAINNYQGSVTAACGTFAGSGYNVVAAVTAANWNLSTVQYTWSPAPTSITHVDDSLGVTRYFAVSPLRPYTVTVTDNSNNFQAAYSFTVTSCAAVRLGMTWSLQGPPNATTGTIAVGCGSTCNATQGDTLCSASLPILCIQRSTSMFPLPARGEQLGHRRRVGERRRRHHRAHRSAHHARGGQRPLCCRLRPRLAGRRVPRRLGLELPSLRRRGQLGRTILGRHRRSARRRLLVAPSAFSATRRRPCRARPSPDPPERTPAPNTTQGARRRHLSPRGRRGNDAGAQPAPDASPDLAAMRAAASFAALHAAASLAAARAAASSAAIAARYGRGP
jgi:hypothetical protein